jgi:hypothetical protein
MRKLTVSLVGLMDLGTLDAIKSVVKNPCVPSLNNESNFSSKLFNIDVQDKSRHITEKESQPLPACL